MSALRKFSFSEISSHTSKNDCWLIIRGKVYDVSEFLDDHPGGDDVLLQAAANGDATQSFEDVGHSTSATGLMKGYLIGSVDGNEAESADTLLDNKPQESIPAASPTNSMDFLLPIFILAIAIAAWYYLTFINVSA